MILPSKHISEDQTLLGVGAVVLLRLEQPETVTSLWEKLRNEQVVGTYQRFVLALDLLYIAGVVNLSKGVIQKKIL